MSYSMPTSLRYLPPGFVNALDFAMYFNDWAAEQKSPLSASAIQARFGCGRATAYRWRLAYRDALARRAIRRAA